MKYQNMKVVEPFVDPAKLTEEDFMNAWEQRAQYNNMIKTMLRPTADAIKLYHWPRGDASVLFHGVELSEGGDHKKSIVITVECHTNGNEREVTYTIPLEACLGGQADVIAFFVEEKAKQEERANEMGKQRDQAATEERRKLYDKLKLEFDPPAPLRLDALMEYGK
jgi:hypothetical protein